MLRLRYASPSERKHVLNELFRMFSWRPKVCEHFLVDKTGVNQLVEHNRCAQGNIERQLNREGGYFQSDLQGGSVKTNTE